MFLKKSLSLLKYLLLTLFKSVLFTSLISFVIYCLLYICPDSDSFIGEEKLKEYDFSIDYSAHDLSEVNQKNIITDLPFVAGEYAQWLLNAITLDFGVRSDDQEKISLFIFDDLIVTLKFVGLAIIVALFISILFLFASRVSMLSRWIVQPFLTLSFFHVVLIYMLLEHIGLNMNFIVIFSLAVGSGVLYDYYTLLSDEHHSILEKDYSLFALNAGYNPYIFASKELQLQLISITASRIPIVFGGMILVEVFSGGGKYAGIGFRIWESFTDNPEYGVIFSATFVSILLFTTIFLIAERLRNNLINLRG